MRSVSPKSQSICLQQRASLRYPDCSPSSVKYCGAGHRTLEISFATLCHACRSIWVLPLLMLAYVTHALLVYVSTRTYQIVRQAVQPDEFKTKMREIRTTSAKGLNFFSIMAKYITPPKISSLLVPLRSIMYVHTTGHSGHSRFSCVCMLRTTRSFNLNDRMLQMTITTLTTPSGMVLHPFILSQLLTGCYQFRDFWIGFVEYSITTQSVRFPGSFDRRSPRSHDSCSRKHPTFQ